MDLGEALIARLQAASAVTAIVGTSPNARIYWIQRPQGSPVPAVVLRESGGLEIENLENDDPDYSETNVTVDCFGRTNLESKALARAVRDALKPAGLQGGFSFDESTVSRPIDLGEPGVDGWQHRATLNCVIRHGAET
jgi:hypothetical protein